MLYILRSNLIINIRKINWKNDNDYDDDYDN